MTLSPAAALLRYLLIAAFSIGAIGPTNAQNADILKTGAVLTRELEAGQVHRFTVRTTDNQAVIVSLRRGNLGSDDEMNYLITVIDPSGNTVEEVNTASDASLCYFRSRESGEHSVVVRRWNGADRGTYDVEILVHAELAGSVSGRIDQLLEPFYSADRPGAAVAAVVGGVPVYQRTFGLASIEYGQAIYNDTPFELASCSKQFTGYAIAMLIEQGVLSESDDIRKYLPEFQYEGDVITIRDLIHHLSGIYDYEPALELVGYPRDGDDLLSTGRILRAVWSQPGTYFEPGTSHRYSNSGYVLLAEIVSRVTGMSFGDWLEQNVLRPAEMNEAYVRDNYRLVERGKAMSYRLKVPSDAPLGPADGYEALPNYLEALGAANVHASLDDMVRWAVNSRNGTLGGTGTVSRFRQGILPEPQDYDYLHGLATSIHRGMKREFHQGLSLGYRTGFYHYPDGDATVIYFANDGEWRTYYLAEKVAEILLDGKLDRHVDSVADSITAPIHSEVTRQQNVDQPSEGELARYVGEFHNGALGSSFTVLLNQGRLEVHSVRERPILLRFTGRHTFASENWAMNTLAFELNNGIIDHVTLRNTSDGRAIRFRRLVKPALEAEP